MPIHLHVSESEEQVTNSRERHGKTPVEQLNDLGVFDHSTIAAHCLALTPDDGAILAEKGVTIARTPITYMKLAMPIHTTVTDLQAAGIKRVALGTDGPASNADMDMFAGIRQIVFARKVYAGKSRSAARRHSPAYGDAQNGAQALGFAESGVLAAGHPADLILVDFDRPHLRPRHDLIANLVHSAKGADVTHVIVDGKLLMRDRELSDAGRRAHPVRSRAARLPHGQPEYESGPGIPGVKRSTGRGWLCP